MSDLTKQQKTWDKDGFNPATEADNIDLFVEHRLNRYTKFKFKDYDLWETFQEDFNNFNLNLLGLYIRTSS